RAERTVCQRELIERPARNLDDHIVQRRLEGGHRLAGHLVADLVQPPADGDLRRDPRDGIASRLRGQCRATGDTRIDLDDIEVERAGVERELDIAATLYTERPNNAQRRRTQHLILTVGERLTGRDDDTVAGMHAEWIEVLHVADGDAGVGAVAD